MKKIILGLCLIFLGVFARAQNGLENIIVEKYYVSNATDSSFSSGNLPAGSVTYRIYADMLPGYKFQAAYGVTGHNLVLTTTTSFFNNTDFGSTAPVFSKTNAAKNSVMLDSWFSVGAGCAGNFGILKAEDDGVANVVNNTPGAPSNKILQNADPSAGIPLTTQDGLIAGAPEAVTFVGLGTLTDQFNDGSTVGNSFITNNGSWASLNGSLGPVPATNKVLIAQITTNGIFHYELNIQIGTPGGGVQNYVAMNPTGAEISIGSLIGTLGVPNALPLVSITSPLNNATFLTGATVGIVANAVDTDGTIDSVQFFVDGVKIGTDITGPTPYNMNWTAVVGSHTLTAKAFDHQLASATSAPITVIVGNVIPPTVSIITPSNGATYILGNTVAISANAADADGTIDSVEFFVDNVKIGNDATGPNPYTFSWPTTIGTHTLLAKATDNDHATTTSAPVSITVFDSSSAYVLQTSSNPCSAGTFCLPLTAIVPVDNVIGYDVVLHYNKIKVQPTGVVVVSNSLINPSYTSTATNIDTANGLMYISVFFNGTAPNNAEFNGTGNVFCVEFAKTANFNFVDAASFSISSLQESYFSGVQTKVVSPGTYSTFQESAFNSSLKFWYDFSPIKYNSANPSQYLITNIYGNDLNCLNPSVAAVQPDLSGNFTYDISNGPAINIQKDILGTTNVQPVINGFDAFLTRRVLVSDATFVPSVYQMIAMDVNMDGVISAGDLSQINQRTVLIIPEFKQSWNYNAQGVSNGQPSKDWLFIDGTTVSSNPAYAISSTFPANDGVGYSRTKVPVVPFCLAVPIFNPTGCLSIGTETYKGILLGDINGNYSTVLPNGAFKQGTDKKIIFDLSKAVVSGGYVDVPVSVFSGDLVHSVDFAMQFNHGNLSYNSIIDHTNYLETLANYNNDDQTLRFTSFSVKNYDINESPVSVRFATKAGQISASDLNSLEGYINGERVGVQVIGSDEISAATIVVYPNPAMDLLNIVTSENASIQLLDMNGRQVIEQTNVNANQKHEVNTQNIAEGVYMLKIFNDNFISFKKVVIKK